MALRGVRFGVYSSILPVIQAVPFRPWGIILDELGLKDQIPYRFDKRIREWCFGSFDGAYGGELFHGVVPRVLDVEDYKTLTLEDLANGICQVDTANWAEPWEVLKSRILEGFEAIAKK